MSCMNEKLLKMFCPLLSCLSALIKTIDFRFYLSGRSVRPNFSVCFYVISYSCFMFPLAATASASWTILSTKFSPLICSDVSLYSSVCFSILFLHFFLCCPSSASSNCRFLNFPFLYLLVCLYQKPFLKMRFPSTHHFFPSRVNCLLYILLSRIDDYFLIVLVQSP